MGQDTSMTKHLIRPALLTAAGFLFAMPVWAQNRVTTPEEQFGHEIGADYVLPNYEALHAY